MMLMEVQHLRSKRNSPWFHVSQPRQLKFQHMSKERSRSIHGPSLKLELNVVRTHFPPYHMRTLTLIAAAETRRVLLSNLPSSLTPEILTSIIFGGTIEQVQYKAGSLNGAVLFQTHQGCMAFFKEAANGLLVPTEDLEIAFVDLDEEVVPYSGESRVFLEKGYTRVVRAVGIGAEWTVEKLTKFAKQGRGSARALDHVRIAVNESGVSDLPKYVLAFAIC